MKSSKNFMSEFNSALNSAKEFEIDIINFGKMNVIDNLKKLERTGKKLRIGKLNCKTIKVRTIYDHIYSIAHSAQLLIDQGLIKCDYSVLAKLIVYHDICEVLITDYPIHTSNYKINSNSIMNAFEVEKSIREEYALNFMWLFANKEQKEAIELINKDCPEQKILWLIDKIDPIVNVWRYMYIYRDTINSLNKEFVLIMADFFTNPKLDMVIENDEYSYIAEIVKYLKNPKKAKRYLELGVLDGEDELNDTDKQLLSILIEKVDLFFD